MNRNWFYYNAARAFANDGEINEALQHIYRAVESGLPKFGLKMSLPLRSLER